jgi:hypothetical protein
MTNSNKVNALNANGDKFVLTHSRRGVDISSQRQDDLDTASLAYIDKYRQQGKEVNALDLGGGFGAHSIRMAAAGALVLLVDIATSMAEQNILTAEKEGKIQSGQVRMLKSDFMQLDNQHIVEKISLFYSQRALHYIPYYEAKKLLSFMFNKMALGGHAFISVAGFDTEYGKTYPDRHLPVEKRFQYLTKAMQEKHGIHHRVVIYKKEELKTLLTDAGFFVHDMRHSTFGNIKAIASKTSDNVMPIDLKCKL